VLVVPRVKLLLMILYNIDLLTNKLEKRGMHQVAIIIATPLTQVITRSTRVDMSNCCLCRVIITPIFSCMCDKFFSWF